MERAQAILSPLYREMVEESLRNLQRQQIARGFFGQLPGAALERSTETDIRTRQAQQTAQLAEQMIGQEHARAMDIARQQLATEQARWAGQQQNLQNILGGAQMGWNIGNQILGGLDVAKMLGLWGFGMQTDPSVSGSVGSLPAPSQPSLRPPTVLNTTTWTQPFRSF